MPINRIGFGSFVTPTTGTPQNGNLPFPQAGTPALFTGGNPGPGTPNHISLASGGMYVLPAGQYLVGTGRQTVLQWYDPLSLMWRNLSPPQNNGILVSSDGASYRLFNASGVVVGGQITNAGTSATVNGIGQLVNGVAVSFGAAPTNGVAATGYAITGGSINTTITITTAGAGYKLPPTLVIDPPPAGGIQATAQVTTLSAAGAITAVTVLNAGAGYATVPLVRVIPAFGETPTTQGVLTVNATLGGSGTLTGLVIQNPGSLYLGTAIPTIAFSGGGLAGGVAATAVMSFCLQSVTITNAGAVYTTATFHPWISSLGSVQNVAAGANTTAFNNDWLGGRPARGTANSGAGTTIAAVSIEDQGFGFQKVPTIGIATAGTTVPTTIALLTPVVGSQTDTSLVQPLP